MRKSGEKLILGVERHFLFMMFFLIGWMVILCLPGVEVPIGNYWWDYPAVKGLEYQLFDVDGAWQDRWLPFLLPLFLLRLAHLMSGYGVDYFLAHALIALPTMFFAYHAVYRNISSFWRVPFFWILVLFSTIPVIVDFCLLKSFRDANAVAYAGFYNRYLDVIFCLVLVSVMGGASDRCVGVRKWLIVFWCYALLVALLSKLTYFVVMWGMLWSAFILRRQDSAILPCSLSAVAACLLAVLLPNYFFTNWEIATVRSISFSAWSLPFLVLAGGGASWLLMRANNKYRRFIFLFMPLVAAWGIGLGNYGDLAMLRYALAITLALWLLGELIGGVQVRIVFGAGEELSKKMVIGERNIVLAISLLLLLYPVTVLLRTSGVTAYAMAARAILPSSSFIEYPNLPGFFSHDLFVARHFRVAHIDKTRVLPLVRKRKSLKHTATFFALYAIDLDKAIGELHEQTSSAVTWISFPGLTSQVFGVGRMPLGARPWYLWGHEIDNGTALDFEAIRGASDLLIVDRCSWAPGASKFRELFGVDDFEQRDASFNTVCFRAIRGGRN